MNNSTKERKFLADNALLFLYLQVYDFLIRKITVECVPNKFFATVDLGKPEVREVLNFFRYTDSDAL